MVARPRLSLRSLLLVVALGAAGLGAVPALAETVELKNGRKIEGRILAQDARTVRIEVEGGSIVLPRDQIADVKETVPPEDELADRLLATQLDDPDAVEALVAWARTKGLESHADQLHELARGVRLERKFRDASRDAHVFPSPRPWLALADWVRDDNYSLGVQRLALEKAREIDPNEPTVRHALARLEAEERAAEAKERLDEARARRGLAAGATTSPDTLTERERALDARERAVAAREALEREREGAGDPEAPPPDRSGTGFLIIRRGGHPGSCPPPPPPPPPSPPPPTNANAARPNTGPVATWNTGGR